MSSISDMFSSSGATHAGSNLMSFLPMIIIFVLFWFLLIRPQQKKAKEHKLLLTGLKSGDEVITISGIAGVVSRVTDNFIVLEVAKEVKLNVQKSQVANILPAGTISKI